ncbi:hypothetical protein VTJ04DRAFT_387 [Mycothermus thermophilus]|uniref:uncharacterized protein n=1 Tax=Humicola insolens TaxID=85995 RepID=UPI003742F0FE
MALWLCQSPSPRATSHSLPFDLGRSATLRSASTSPSIQTVTARIKKIANLPATHQDHPIAVLSGHKRDNPCALCPPTTRQHLPSPGFFLFFRLLPFALALRHPSPKAEQKDPCIFFSVPTPARRPSTPPERDTASITRPTFIHSLRRRPSHCAPACPATRPSTTRTSCIATVSFIPNIQLRHPRFFCNTRATGPVIEGRPAIPSFLSTALRIVVVPTRG